MQAAIAQTADLALNVFARPDSDPVVLQGARTVADFNRVSNAIQQDYFYKHC
jgi:hypothetical protein